MQGRSLRRTSARNGKEFIWFAHGVRKMGVG